jgi:hypothetical protein
MEKAVDPLALDSGLRGNAEMVSIAAAQESK